MELSSIFDLRYQDGWGQSKGGKQKMAWCGGQKERSSRMYCVGIAVCIGDRQGTLLGLKLDVLKISITIPPFDYS